MADRVRRRAEPVDVFAIAAPAALPTDPGPEPEAPAPREERRRSRTARTDWRLGGRTVRRWRESVLAVALIALAAAIAAATLVDAFWTDPRAGAVSTAIVWVGLAIAVVYAFGRSRPVGLFRFRPLDLLYGVAFALVLRLVQGGIEASERGAALFPSVILVDGRTPLDWWVVDVAGGLAIAPVLEELFFRGVVLVGVYSLLRRPFGALSAGIASVFTSSGLFVLLHALLPGTDLSGTLTLLLLGIVCASLVMLTGRIWGAVLVHVLYNATYLALVGVAVLLG